jgi:hypothetical protein
MQEGNNIINTKLIKYIDFDLNSNRVTLNDRIRDKAYKIWLKEGKPHNSEFRHWIMAEEIINNILDQFENSKVIII